MSYTTCDQSHENNERGEWKSTKRRLGEGEGNSLLNDGRVTHKRGHDDEGSGREAHPATLTEQSVVSDNVLTDSMLMSLALARERQVKDGPSQGFVE